MHEFPQCEPYAQTEETKKRKRQRKTKCMLNNRVRCTRRGIRSSKFK